MAVQKKYLLFVLLFMMLSCSKNNLTLPNQDDSSYLPLAIGNYWIFEVAETEYATTSNPININYQLKEVITDSYTDNEQPFYHYERYVRTSETNEWQIQSIGILCKKEDKVIRISNSVPMVELYFPIIEAMSWNSNSYNMNAPNAYVYKNLNKPFKTTLRTFDKSVIVQAQNDSSLVSLEKHNQVYSTNIGMIYSENISLQYCQSSSNCIGKGIIAYGSSQKKTLIASNLLN